MKILIVFPIYIIAAIALFLIGNLSSFCLTPPLISQRISEELEEP